MWYIYLPEINAFLSIIRRLYAGQQAQKLQTTTIPIIKMKAPKETPTAMDILHHKHNVLDDSDQKCCSYNV